MLRITYLIVESMLYQHVMKCLGKGFSHVGLELDQ